MRRLVYCTVAAAISLAAGRETAGNPVPDGTAPPIEVGNAFCPVTGAKVGSMGAPVTYAYEGRLYNLCCPGCKRTIEQDPARYTSRVKSLAVEAFRFGFEPETIAVRQGDIVVIDLSSRDTRHGFYIKEYGINAQFGNDRTEKVSFIADRRGEFPILCSVYCGARHGRMKATLIVQ